MTIYKEQDDGLTWDDWPAQAAAEAAIALEAVEDDSGANEIELSTTDDLGGTQLATEAKKALTGDMVIFVYKGDGFFSGVPARDLTGDDLARLGPKVAARLKASNLYEYVGGLIDAAAPSDESNTAQQPGAKSEKGPGQKKGGRRRK